jgi:hypothetical protein
VTTATSSTPGFSEGHVEKILRTRFNIFRPLGNSNACGKTDSHDNIDSNAMIVKNRASHALASFWADIRLSYLSSSVEARLICISIVESYKYILYT